MAEQPAVTLRTRDLDRALGFYVGRAGFTLEERDDARALVRNTRGRLIQVVGPDVEAESLPLGISPSWVRDDLDDLRTRFPEGRLETVPWGDRRLIVPGPDGHHVSFVEVAKHPPDEWFELYRRGPEELDDALAGLAEEDMDLSREPGGWSIRMIVHHVADGDGLFLMRMNYALGEPGRTFVMNWPSDNVKLPENLKYVRRPIEPSLALFRATRAHFVQLVEYVPGAFERSVADTRFVDDMAGMARHALEHAAEIREIRRTHGR